MKNINKRYLIYKRDINQKHQLQYNNLSLVINIIKVRIKNN
jgi:hypothetical protein